MAHVEELSAGLLDVNKCQESPAELVREYSDQLKRLLEAVDDGSADKGTLDRGGIVVPALIAAAAHVGNHYWTNEDSRQLAQKVLSCLATTCGCGTSEELLVGRDGGDERGLIKAVLSRLKPRLTRETWKDNPAHKQAMVWCVRHLKHPHLSAHLDSILPATLLFLDDHEDYHKVLGLTSATHVIKNVDPTELRWYGRAEVLYEAVKHLLHWSDPDIINALHPCLLVLLPVLDPPPKSSPAKPNRMTVVFDTLLTSIQLESKIVSRKACLSHVANYIETLGIYSTRHLKVLVPTLLSCMEHPDYCGEFTRRYALSALGALIKHAWPRIPHHKEAILKALLQLVADLCPSTSVIPSSKEVQSQLKLVALCLKLLAEACQDLKTTYSSLISSSSHSGLKDCLQKALSS